MARFVYTQVASPAALASIVAGSAVFWVDNTVTFWLIAKLTVVTLLVATHAAMGLLVLRMERAQLAGLRPTRSEEHTSELQSRGHIVCRLLLEKKKR